MVYDLIIIGGGPAASSGFAGFLETQRFQFHFRHGKTPVFPTPFPAA